MPEKPSIMDRNYSCVYLHCLACQAIVKINYCQSINDHVTWGLWREREREREREGRGGGRVVEGIRVGVVEGGVTNIGRPLPLLP